MCSESAPSPHSPDHLFEGYSQVHLTSRVVIIEDTRQTTAVATALKPAMRRWSHFLGDWFSWASGKKSENHHRNGAVAPRAAERGVSGAVHVCEVSHKTTPVTATSCLRVGHLLRQNVAVAALVSKGLWANWRDFWSLKNRVWVTSETPNILLQPTPILPGMSFLGSCFSLFPYPRISLAQHCRIG